MTMAGAGCAHSQRPESRVYVISENAEGIGTGTGGSGSDVCQQELEKCMTSCWEKKLEFSRMNEALEWLKEHKTEVVLGTIVVVAGVAFVVTTGGSGLLLLAPLSL